MYSYFHRLSKGHWPIFLLSNISSLANLFLPIILVRLLSPEEMGLYKTFFLYIMFLPFLCLAGGPVNSVFYWVGQGKDERQGLIQASWWVTLVLSALVLLLLPFVSFIEGALELPRNIIYLLIVSSFLVCPSGHYNEVCVAQGERVKGTLLGVSFELIKTIGFILLAYWQKNVDYLFCYFTLMMVVSFMLMTLLGLKHKTVTLVPKRDKAQRVFSYSLPISLSALLHFAVDKSDMIFLSFFLGKESFAFYSLGCLVIPPLYILEMSVQKVLIPSLSESYTNKDFKGIQLSFRKAIENMAFLIIPSFFGLYFFSEVIIKIIYTETYLASADFLKLFSWSYLLLVLPHDSLYRASGKTKELLSNYIYFSPFIVLVVFLAAYYTNASYTLIAAMSLKFIFKLFCLFKIRSQFGLSLREMIPFKRLLRFSLISMVLTVISFQVRAFFIEDRIWFFVVCPLFVLLYFSQLLIFKER